MGRLTSNFIFIFLVVLISTSACTGKKKKGGGGGGGEGGGGGPGVRCRDGKGERGLVSPDQLTVLAGQTKSQVFRTINGNLRITNVRAEKGTVSTDFVEGPDRGFISGVARGVSVVYTPPVGGDAPDGAGVVPPGPGGIIDTPGGFGAVPEPVNPAGRAGDQLVFELFDREENCSRVARVPVNILPAGAPAPPAPVMPTAPPEVAGPRGTIMPGPLLPLDPALKEKQHAP